VLIGHSYGGMVATGVADRARDRVVQLIYLDAFCSEGRAVSVGSERAGPAADAGAREGRRQLAGAAHPTPPDTSQADLGWLTERRVFQPIKCFEMPLKLRGGELTLPRSYIYAPVPRRQIPSVRSPSAPNARLAGVTRTRRQPFAERHRAEALMALLEKIVAEPAVKLRGVRRVAPNPSFLEYQPACKRVL